MAKAKLGSKYQTQQQQQRKDGPTKCGSCHYNSSGIQVRLKICLLHWRRHNTPERQQACSSHQPASFRDASCWPVHEEIAICQTSCLFYFKAPVGPALPAQQLRQAPFLLGAWPGKWLPAGPQEWFSVIGLRGMLCERIWLFLIVCFIKACLLKQISSHNGNVFWSLCISKRAG